MEPLIPYFPPVRLQIAEGLFIQGAGTMVVVKNRPRRIVLIRTAASLRVPIATAAVI